MKRLAPRRMLQERYWWLYGQPLQRRAQTKNGSTKESARGFLRLTDPGIGCLLDALEHNKNADDLSDAITECRRAGRFAQPVTSGMQDSYNVVEGSSLGKLIACSLSLHKLFLAKTELRSQEQGAQCDFVGAFISVLQGALARCLRIQTPNPKRQSKPLFLQLQVVLSMYVVDGLRGWASPGCPSWPVADVRNPTPKPQTPSF